MRVLEYMDRLLLDAEANGREPQHWMIRQSDWLEIGRLFRAGELPEPDAVGSNTYKGIPVHFSKLEGGQIVGIVDASGVAAFEAA